MTNDDWPGLQPHHPQQKPGVDPTIWRGLLFGLIIVLPFWVGLFFWWWVS